MTEDYRRKKGILEAVLFAMGEEVSLTVLMDAVQTSRKETEQILQEMMWEYETFERGIRLIRMEDCYQLCTAKEYYDSLVSVLVKPKKRALSDAMLEVLAIVAYQQPVTKSAIEQIRGVRSDHAVNKLMEYELIEERGRLEAPGRPILFGTTQNFLRHFGLSSIEQLPLLEQDFELPAEEETHPTTENQETAE